MKSKHRIRYDVRPVIPGGRTLAGFVLLLAMSVCHGCGEGDDALAPNISVSGTVTNASGYSGTIIVEISRSLRDVASAGGQYSIAIHRDFYIDSLYSWVDRDGNNAYTQGEPFGFYHSSGDPDHAKPIHARDQNVGHVNFSIP